MQKKINSQLWKCTTFLCCVLLLAAFCCSYGVSAQEIKRSVPCVVKVLDEFESPLIGALVVIKGTSDGQVTNIDGISNFMHMPSDGVLVVSFLGYDSVEVPVAGKRDIVVKLSVASLEIDEVVVVGYGTMRKRDLSGSVAQVKGEILQEIPSVSAAGALQGRVSGVQVSQNSGQPGSTMQIRIRGANSVQGSNEPLWIINGFPGDIEMINNADIESIEILKDASATAIYGSRGANGVVIVTTKSAREGDVMVEYRGNVGVQNVVKTMEMMNAWEYMDYLNTKSEINGGSVIYTPEQIAAVASSTDWQKEVFRSSIITEHSVNINGGNSKYQGALGLSYFNQAGIIKNSGYQRISINADMKYNLSKYVTTNANIIFSRSDRNQLDASSVIYNALGASPLATPRKENGEWNDFLDQPTSESNALAIINEIQNKWYSNRLMVNAGITVKPVSDLSIQTSVNILNKDDRNDYYIPTTYKENYEGKASISFGNTLQFTNNNIITYNKGFGKHHLNVMGGITYETMVTKGVDTGAATGFLSDIVGTYDLNAATVKGLPASSYSDWKMLSFLGRINYNYADRYLLTVSFRSDGSSRFNKGNKWGYFPSAAVAWRLKQEAFLQDVEWLSELKLRVGYGVTGSTAISPYATMNTLTSENVAFGTSLGKETVVAYLPSYTYVGDLKWERTAQTDIGLDLSFFNNRLRFTMDYYYKKTTNLLNNVELPRSSGYTTALRNIGSLSNRGFELQVDGRIIDSVVKWDLGANFSLNRSRIDELADHEDIFGSTISSSNGLVNGQLNLIREGEPMCVFYGYVEDGYAEKGMIVYKDIDGVEGISSADRTIIGDPNPNFLLNFNTTLKYKRFSLSAFFQGSFGNDIYGISMATFAYRYNYNANSMKEVMGNYWTGENPNSKYPNMVENINLKLSDRFVYDGSYLRLKNLELAYDIPCGKEKSIKSARISLSASNLLTITKYPFWDPDVNSKGGSSSIVQGVDAAGYPSARTFSLGCRLTF